MLPPLECFAFQLKTKQGDSIGVGGLCYAPKAQYWVERLQVLQNLRVHNSNIVQVDMDLADALTALSNESLVVAGITLFAKNLELPDGIRTGGVIGSPNCPSYSADSTVEDLPEGFVQCAMPGGPGLAAQASKAVVEKALHHIQSDFSVSSQESELLSILRSNGIQTGLLVYDGTGKQAPGCLLAFTENQSHFVRLKKLCV